MGASRPRSRAHTPAGRVAHGGVPRLAAGGWEVLALGCLRAFTPRLGGVSFTVKCAGGAPFTGATDARVRGRGGGGCAHTG